MPRKTATIEKDPEGSCKIYAFGPDMKNPHQHKLTVPYEDRVKFDDLPMGKGDQAVLVYDFETCKSYWVRRAPCGGDTCYCAAQVLPINDQE